MRIDSRAAVVTGASSGIGVELARGLAAMGIPVGLTARRADRLEALADEIRGKGGTAAVAAADAADPEATRGALARLSESLGPIDLLIANAGLGEATPARGFSADAFEKVVRVNCIGAANAIEAVLPGMIARGRGHVAGISSLASYRGLPSNAGYCASKAALSLLLECLRVELRGTGVRVTTVHPGFIDTPMTAAANHPQPFKMGPERAARTILRGIARGRREVNFPLPMALLMAAVRRLPDAVYDPLVRVFVRPEHRSFGPDQ